MTDTTTFVTRTDRRGYEALDEIYEKYIREVG